MKISIIIPVYKVERYIENTIDSILIQTFNDYEIILVDDASPDNCGVICDLYSKKYANITTIHNQSNMGVSESRNRGLAIAKGEWIWFIDSDDKISSFSLQKLSNSISPCYDVVFFGFQYIKENKDFLEKKRKVKIPISERVDRENIATVILKYDREHMFAPVWNKLYKHEFLVDNKLYFENIGVEDIFFNCSVFSKTNKILILDECLYFYLRRWSGSLSISKETENVAIYKKRYLSMVNLLRIKNSLTSLNKIKVMQGYIVRLCYVIYVQVFK